MFERIIQFLREAWRKFMIGSNDIKSVLKVEPAVSTEMSTAISQWALMYSNQASYITADIKTLGLPASIAAELARATTIEMKVTLTGSARATFLQAQLDRVLAQLRQQVEYGCAKGGLVLKPYVVNGEIRVDFVQADSFIPTAFDSSGNITGIVFADQTQSGDKFYTRLEYHRFESGAYTIQNLAFRSTTRDTLGQAVALAEVPAWAELQPQTTFANIKRPLFGYFRYPLANNIDTRSPLGVSCFARAVDTIEQADRLYSNLVWEFESGKRALYMDNEAFDKNTAGKPVLPDRRLYRAINATGNVGGEQLFKEWSPRFREASILAGLDALLKKIEFQCALAYGTISDPQTVEKTATEIAATKQRSAAQVVDTQKALQFALDGLLYAMDTWATLMPSLALSVPRGTYTANYDFDDSLVIDAEAQRTQDRESVSMGVMPKYLYLMRNYGLDEATAKTWIAQVADEENEAINAGYAATPEQ
jgi:A118 family predicted phage portal protein